MASAAGGSGGGQNPGVKCEFCSGPHRSDICQSFKSMDSYIFGYRKMQTMMLLARAKNDLLLFKGSKTSSAYRQFREQKMKRLHFMKSKVEADRDKLRAFMKATNELQQCLGIPADNVRQIYTLLGHPQIASTQQRQDNSTDPAHVQANRSEQQQRDQKPGTKDTNNGKRKQN